MVKYVQKKGDRYVPSDYMKKHAWVNSKKIYTEANKNPKQFWAKLSKEGIQWHKPWKTTYEEKLPYFKWFVDGKLNFSENCLDRHLEEKANQTAILFVPEPTNEKPQKITYKQLHEDVCTFANVLKSYGVEKGDVVSIYMPLIPEAAVAMLACTRIGAIHSIVFSAFSSDALNARIKDGNAKVLITADGYYRRGEKEDLLRKAMRGAKRTSVQKIVVVPRLGKKLFTGKQRNYYKEMKKAKKECKPTYVNAQDTMFILYTSGTTGKPKGVLHDTGGYATQAYWTTKWNFDIKKGDVMWCTADIGWITGHTYTVYGPLLNGATTLLYEGSPDYPNIGRWWNIIDKYNVTAFYTAPTAIRMFIKADQKYLNKAKLSSLKILGSVGEPIDLETWKWYYKHVGKSRCPIIDTWWQTETGTNMITSLPGVGPFVPTVSGLSCPGVTHLVVDDKGRTQKPGELGFLVQKSPFAPAMLRGVHNNHKKYVDTYWRFWTKHKKKYYDTSDGAFMTKDGLIRITGRTDDVMKVAGHRLATAELESGIAEYRKVNECGVVPIPHEVKGQVPVAFVILKRGNGSEKLEKQIKKHVDKKIGPTARPAKVYFVPDLPKTRSGKIMRRILKNILNKEEPAGLATLVNPESVEKIRQIVYPNA